MTEYTLYLQQEYRRILTVLPEHVVNKILLWAFAKPRFEKPTLRHTRFGDYVHAGFNARPFAWCNRDHFKFCCNEHKLVWMMEDSYYDSDRHIWVRDGVFDTIYSD